MAKLLFELLLKLFEGERHRLSPGLQHVSEGGVVGGQEGVQVFFSHGAVQAGEEEGREVAHRRGDADCLKVSQCNLLENSVGFISKRMFFVEIVFLKNMIHTEIKLNRSSQ